MNKEQLAKKLALPAYEQKLKHTSFLVGFDGFTDEIIRPVDTRHSASSYTVIDTIAAFAGRIMEASGKSCNLEFVSQQIKAGGNGPILADALSAFGCAPTLIGCLGEEHIEELFQPLARRCKEVITLAASGHTDAIEFRDGKLLFGNHQSVLTITKELLQQKIPVNKWIELLDSADILASVNWTMVPSMTDIWKWLLSDILPHTQKRERLLFIDLADPAKRSDDDLRIALRTLQEMKAFYRVHLGLNEKESERVLHLYGVQAHTLATGTVCCSSIRAHTGLDVVVIHTLKTAACASQNDACQVDGPYCDTPLLTTGGGDNFNAGYLAGQALQCTSEESLLMGVATSGFYVRTGRTPHWQELIQFLINLH